jgi:hypothetical protein
MKNFLKIIADILIACFIAGTLAILVSFIPYLSKSYRANAFYVQGIYNCILDEGDTTVFIVNIQRGLHLLKKASELEQKNNYYKYALIYFSPGEVVEKYLNNRNLPEDVKLYALGVNCKNEIEQISKSKISSTQKAQSVLMLLNSLQLKDPNNAYIDYMKASVYIFLKDNNNALKFLNIGNKKPELRT